MQWICQKLNFFKKKWYKISYLLETAAMESWDMAVCICVCIKCGGYDRDKKIENGGIRFVCIDGGWIEGEKEGKEDWIESRRRVMTIVYSDNLLLESWPMSKTVDNFLDFFYFLFFVFLLCVSYCDSNISIFLLLNEENKDFFLKSKIWDFLYLNCSNL